MPSKKATPADVSEFARRLDTKVFHVPPRPGGMSALERLMALVVQGDQGSYVTAQRAVRALHTEFVHWNEVRVARGFEVQDALLAHRIGEVQERSERVQDLLRRVFGMQNHLDLDWLYDATSERREKLLSALGVAPAHARHVLDLDAWMEADDEDDEDEEARIPVPPALKRMCARLGWVPRNPKEAAVRELLEPVWEGEDAYPRYLALNVVARLLPASKPSRCPRTEALAKAYRGRRSVDDAAWAELMEAVGYRYPPAGGRRKGRRKAAKKGAKRSARTTARKAQRKTKSGRRKTTRKR